MRKRWFLLLLIIPLGLVACLLASHTAIPQQPARAVLKDETIVTGKVVEKEYGKFIVIKTDASNQQVIVWDQLKYINEPKHEEGWCRGFFSSVGNSLSQLAVAAGLVGFFIGLWQYQDAQKWKRTEFINKEIGAYEEIPYVSNAHSVLDSTGEEVELPPSDASGVTPSMVVDSNTLTRVLGTPDPAKPFNAAEKRIRDSFDSFLSNLERFNSFIDLGLVKKKEINFYLSYWLKIMGDPNNNKLTSAARTQLWKYIKENDYPGVIQLFNKFDYKFN